MNNSSITTISPDFMPGEKEEAIPLITFDSITKKFLINENAEQILRKLESPLGVVSVAGMYRTGKSYLLNRVLLNRSDGFSVGPSINPCTKGLWIWPKTISGFAPDGTPLNVIVIDTEGMGATDEDQNHDNKIFTLGILLSSYFIFNSLGAIDENAIQNLSFIVNITKNIQLHNSRNEDVEIRDISSYLPSFMWVIRDFSLRLTNTDGDAITSKEYLEKSLELQKGYSETVETKNKIRTLIKEFFRERDCVTLVRPLTEEGNLQNLSKMDQHTLRPEFIQQVNNLRKKVIHKVKAKSMNGKFLNGEMFCNLMTSYVNAINSGAVPVIENAWTYMCKNECNRAMNNALIKYNDLMNEMVKAHLPLHEKELDSHHREAKKGANTFYQTAALGVYYDEYLAQLKENIKEKHLQYKIENERETKKSCEYFLQLNYSEIKHNLAANGYQNNFPEFKHDVEAFICFYSEKAPNGPGRNLFLYEFILSEILLQSEKFFAYIFEDFEIATVKNKEEINRLNSIINEMKSEFTKENMRTLELIKKLDNERNEFLLQDKNVKENLSFIAREKDSSIKELYVRIDCLKREYEKKIIEMRSQLELTEESSREREIEMKLKESEFDKSKLLLEQKIKFFEKSYEEITDKEKEYLNEIKSLRKDCITSSKDSVEKYEVQIRSLNEKYELMQEKNIDLETKLLEKERRSENEKLKCEEQLNDMKKKIQELNGLLDISEADVNNLEIKNSNEKDKIKSEFEMKIAELRDENENTNSKLKDNEEKFNLLKNKGIKETSILRQNLEFAELQIKELRIQINDDKKTNIAIINVLEEKNFALINTQEDMLHKMSDLKLDHLNEYNQVKSELEQKEAHYKAEIAHLNSMCSECEVKLSESKEESEKTREELYKIKSKLDEEIKELTEKLISSVKEKQILNTEHKSAVESLNIASMVKIESCLKQCRLEMETNNERNEKNILDIKKHYEAEKINIDLKLAEEKEKMNRQIHDIDNYYLDKLKEIEKIREERINELEETLESMEMNHNNYLIHTEQELAVKNQQIESTNKFLNESRENLLNLQQTHENVLDNVSQRFKEEKIEWQNSFDKIIREIKDKERENGSLFTKNEQMEQTIETLRNQIKSTTVDMSVEKSELNEKLSQLSLKLQSLNEELSKVKAESSKELALKIQELEFNAIKINQMQKYIEESNIKAEEKVKTIKEALQAEFNDKINQLNKDKLELETKLNQKRKEIKEQEMNNTKDKSMLEKEKAVLIEKLVSANKLKEELAESLEKERENLISNIEMARSEAKRESELTLKENEMMKSKLKKLGNDYNELSVTYEKDTDLWSTKFVFLEEQKNQARLDLTECQKKFEMQLENLSKKGVVEKDKMDNMQSALIVSIEQKFKSYYKELQDNYNAKIEETNSKRRSLEQENKSLLEKLKEKSDNQALAEMEKNLNLLSGNENKLKKELVLMTADRENKIRELSLLVESERALNKQKSFELENKLREYESKRSNMAVDTIKEKALTDRERQSKQDEIESLNERIRSIERLNLKINNENKELIRDNEKMKKGSKLSSNNNSNIFVPKYSNRFATANKENVRNHSNTSFDLRTELRTYDRLDLLTINKPKFSTTKNSQKSDDDNLNTSNILV